MAVEAVASVVIQKLTDMLTEENIISYEVIVNHLGVIKEALEEMGGYFIDAEDKRNKDKCVQQWTDEYLSNLYYVEDAIESFALRFTLQSRRLGFLMDHALFLNNFTACRKLGRKMTRIRMKMQHLNRSKPSEVKDASVRSALSLLNCTDHNNRSFGLGSIDENGDADHGEDHEEQQEQEMVQFGGLIVTSTPHPDPPTVEYHYEVDGYLKNEGQDQDVVIHHYRRSSSTILENHTFASPAVLPLRSLSHASLYRPGLKQSKSMSDYSNYKEEENDFFGGFNEDPSLEDDHHNKDKNQSNLPYVSNAELPLRSISENSLLGDRYNQSKLMYSYSYHEEALNIVGFQKDVDFLLKILTNPNQKATRIVSIVGEMGSGKTTLARLIYRNRNIKECFPLCCAWVTVSRDSNSLDLLLKLLNQVSNSKDHEDLIQEEVLVTRLFERLRDKKYLIVLDGVRSPDTWESVKDAFPDNRNGSKILLTCLEQVAEDPDGWFHRLSKLNYEDSWNLFLKKAGLEQGPNNMRKMLLQACDRLPINLVLLGSLLSVKKDQDIVSSLRNWGLMASSSNQPKWETMEILSLSYNDLPVSSKLCLLYMVLFPKEFDVPVRRLLRLWQAEGFVKRPDDTKKFPEDVAQEYFNDLVKRSLIQVSKLRSDGSAKKCRLLGVVYDYLLPRALDISLFHIHNKTINYCGSRSPLGVRRLVEYTDIKNCPLYPKEFGKLRSYLSFSSQKKDTPAKEVGNLLTGILDNGLRLLRVLDLEGVYKPDLPKNLGDLFHLRYLGLRWTFLEALPKSVGNLHFLETLDVKHTYINTLPTFIWKLKRLRHLNLNDIRLDIPSHVRGSIPQLLTLWGLFVDDESLVRGGLNKLEHLRELGISFCLTNSEELLDWVSQLTDLQSLRLRSKNDLGRPSKLRLKPLTKLVQLSHLNLMGSLAKLPDKLDFPQGLKKLTLSVSRLVDDPMPVLEQLPSLGVLRLLANSYLGKKMVCRKGGFPELRGLKLWWMPNLEDWEVEEGSMDRLKELNVRCCRELKYIPPILLRQKTFKELTLTNMLHVLPQVEKIKSVHVAVTCKDYDFTQAPVSAN